MPLNKKGKEIMKSMKKEYGKKKGEQVFYASKNKGTIKNVEKASKGKMMKVKKVKAGLEKASRTHAAQAKILDKVLKAAGGGLKEATQKLKAKGYTGGDMALKKIPEGPKGEGLRKLKVKRPDITRKMGFAKKGKVMKAAMGAVALGALGAKAAEKLMKKKKKASAISPAMDYLGDTAKNKSKGGKVMKAFKGDMARGYGAARTQGQGLQDENLIPGKSLDYYKDLM